jgi:hypothetical protein
MAFLDENLTPSVTQETDAALVSLGQRGCAIGDSGSVPVGNYAAIQCLTETEFDQLDTVEGSGTNSPFSLLVTNAIPVIAGTIIYGPFTAISSVTGVYIAYKA